MPKEETVIVKKEIIDLFTTEHPVQTIACFLEKSKLSLRTIHRRIKSADIISSYNKNSIFYTMPKFAEFDSNGIWIHNDACFSVNGHLSNTIKILINSSISGYTASELGKILHVKVDDFLRILFKKREIKRDLFISRNVYFSANESVAQNQILARKELLKNQPVKKPILPKRSIQFSILIEIILNQELNIEPAKLRNRLKKKGIIVSTTAIDDVMDFYNLKKTLR